MMQDNRHRQHLKAIVEVNMTPLMDLTFMLLIVFIITVPVLDYTTDITPPQMTTPNAVRDTSKNLMVTLDKDGRCFVNGIQTAADDLENAFMAQKKRCPDGVILRSDGHRPLNDVVAVMRAAKNADMKISLMTEEEEEKPSRRRN